MADRMTTEEYERHIHELLEQAATLEQHLNYYRHLAAGFAALLGESVLIVPIAKLQEVSGSLVSMTEEDAHVVYSVMTQEQAIEQAAALPEQPDQLEGVEDA